jgi:hypothetical protein
MAPMGHPIPRRSNAPPTFTLTAEELKSIVRTALTDHHEEVVIPFQDHVAARLEELDMACVRMSELMIKTDKSVSTIQTAAHTMSNDLEATHSRILRLGDMVHKTISKTDGKMLLSTESTTEVRTAATAGAPTLAQIASAAGSNNVNLSAGNKKKTTEDPPNEDKRRMILQLTTDDKTPKEQDAAVLSALNNKAEELKLSKKGVKTFVRVFRNKNNNISILTREHLHAATVQPYAEELLKVAQKTRPHINRFFHPVTWHKFVLHGVDVKTYLLKEDGMEQLRKDIGDFNNLSLPLRPSWTSKPEALKLRHENEAKNRSACIVTYAGKQLSHKALQRGISIAGLPHKALPFLPSNKDTLCGKCCRWGHSTYNCNEEPRCGVCSGPHKTTTHKCDKPECTASIGTKCKHQTYKCPNCPVDGKHDHRVNDKVCPAKVAAIAAGKAERAKRQSEAAKPADQNVVMAEDDKEEDDDSSSEQMDADN